MCLYTWESRSLQKEKVGGKEPKEPERSISKQKRGWDWRWIMQADFLLLLCSFGGAFPLFLPTFPESALDGSPGVEKVRNVSFSMRHWCWWKLSPPLSFPCPQQPILPWLLGIQGSSRAVAKDPERVSPGESTRWQVPVGNFEYVLVPLPLSDLHTARRVKFWHNFGKPGGENRIKFALIFSGTCEQNKTHTHRHIVRESRKSFHKLTLRFHNLRFRRHKFPACLQSVAGSNSNRVDVQQELWNWN